MELRLDTPKFSYMPESAPYNLSNSYLHVHLYTQKECSWYQQMFVMKAVLYCSQYRDSQQEKLSLSKTDHAAMFSHELAGRLSCLMCVQRESFEMKGGWSKIALNQLKASMK